MATFGWCGLVHADITATTPTHTHTHTHAHTHLYTLLIRLFTYFDATMYTLACQTSTRFLFPVPAGLLPEPVRGREAVILKSILPAHMTCYEPPLIRCHVASQLRMDSS
jgi:hypothetical protein